MGRECEPRVLTETQTRWLNNIRNDAGGCLDTDVRRLAGMIYDLIGVVERLQQKVNEGEA